MGRGPARWIALALVAAMVAAVGVGLVTGGGEPAADGVDGDGTGGEPANAAATEALDGPHVWFDLCTGAVCPPADEAAQGALVAEMEADPRVASVLLVTSEQAYQLFLDRFGDQRELVESVRPQEVPARIELDLLEPDDVPDVMTAYGQRDGVASANDARAVGP